MRPEGVLIMKFSNNLSFEQKKMVCRKLNSLYNTRSVERRNKVKSTELVECLCLLNSLACSIENGQILNQKEINQVNYFLSFKFLIIWTLSGM